MAKVQSKISKSDIKNAVYAYVSSCCSVLADKPSVKDNEGKLGKWRCGGCRKRCTVRPADKSKFQSVSQAGVA